MKFRDLVFLAEIDYSNVPGEHSQQVRNALRGDEPESFKSVTLRINDKKATHDYYDFIAQAKRAGVKAELAAEASIYPTRDYYRMVLNGPEQSIADFVNYITQLPGVKLE